MGDRFLRHIERTKVLIHLIDIASCDCRDPYKDYISLNKELKLYSNELAKKPQLVVLNKCDLEQAKDNIKKFKKHIRCVKVFTVSAKTGEGVKELLNAVYKKAGSIKKDA